MDRNLSTVRGVVCFMGTRCLTSFPSMANWSPERLKSPPSRAPDGGAVDVGRLWV